MRRGDIVYMDFDPQSGHEQAGRRPAMVVSNDLYNRVSNLTMVCPITRTVKENPFHVALDGRTKVRGCVLCEHARTLDLLSRGAQTVERAPEDIVDTAVKIILSFLE